jgi:hypothetical protein
LAAWQDFASNIRIEESPISGCPWYIGKILFQKIKNDFRYNVLFAISKYAQHIIHVSLLRCGGESSHDIGRMSNIVPSLN